MVDVVTDPAVVGSVLVTVVLAMLAAAVRVVGPSHPGGASQPGPAPAWWAVNAGLWGVGIAVALTIARPSLDPLVTAPRGLVWWTIPVAAGGAAAAVAASVAAIRHPDRGRAHTVAVAAATVGAFGCVPETDVLRLLPGPVAVAAAAAWLGWVRPIGPAGTAVVATAVAWLTVVGGQARPASVIGAAAGLAAVAALTLVWRRTDAAIDTGRRPMAAVVIVVVAILALSRVAGTQERVGPAMVATVVIAGAMVASLSMMAGRSGERPTPSSAASAADPVPEPVTGRPTPDNEGGTR